MEEKKLNSETPQWFKEWHAYHYFPFRQEFRVYKVLQWVIFTTIVAALLIELFGGCFGQR